MTAEEDVRVWIGDEMCDIRSISDTILRCALPEEKPSNGDFMGGDKERNLPVVWVSLNVKLMSLNQSPYRYLESNKQLLKATVDYHPSLLQFYKFYLIDICTLECSNTLIQ